MKPDGWKNKGVKFEQMKKNNSVMSKGNSYTKACSYPLTNPDKMRSQCASKTNAQNMQQSRTRPSDQRASAHQSDSQPSEETTKEGEIFENEI